MSERVLRDHSQPCEHYDPEIAGHDPSITYLLGHVVIGFPGGFWCPGGREVTIDRNAAADQLGLIDWMAMQTKHPSSVEMPPYEWLLAEASAIVDAALGEV